MSNETVVIECFGGPLHGNEYALPADEMYLAVARPAKPLTEFEADDLVPVEIGRGYYKKAVGVDGKVYMLWEGWAK